MGKCLHKTVLKKISFLYSSFKVFYLRRYGVLILMLFSVVFSLFLLRYNFGAQWSIIDDHEIAYFLGVDKKILVSEFPSIISETEVGNFGTSLRYRPSYYILRVTEASLWRDNPHMWYFVRYIFLVFFLFTLSYLVSKYFGILPAVIFSLFAMTSTCWSDIWTRLGPAEIYVTLGLSLYAIGFFKIFKEKTESIFPWLAFLLGGLIAIGSKENMVILALTSLYLLIELVRHKVGWKLIIPVLHIIFSVLIFSDIYMAISKSGQDIYANQINFLKIIQLVNLGFVKTINNLKLDWILVVVVLIVVLGFSSLQISRYKRYLIKNKDAFLFLIFLALTYFFQFIFYSGGWQTNTRYGFPGIMAKQLFWLIFFYLSVSLVSYEARCSSKMKRYKLIVLNIIFFGCMLFLVFRIGYTNLINASKINAQTTQTFTRNILNLSGMVKTHPDYVIVIVSNNPRDYEKVFSLERFLRFKGVNNDILLNYRDLNIGKEIGLYKYLSDSLTKISEQGLVSGGEILFRKIDMESKSKNCFSILFSNTVDDSGCLIKYNF